MGMFSNPCGDEKQYKMSAEGQSFGVTWFFSSHGPTPHWMMSDRAVTSVSKFARLLRQEQSH